MNPVGRETLWRITGADSGAEVGLNAVLPGFERSDGQLPWSVYDGFETSNACGKSTEEPDEQSLDDDEVSELEVLLLKVDVEVIVLEVDVEELAIKDELGEDELDDDRVASVELERGGKFRVVENDRCCSEVVVTCRV